MSQNGQTNGSREDESDKPQLPTEMTVQGLAALMSDCPSLPSRVANESMTQASAPLGSTQPWHQTKGNPPKSSMWVVGLALHLHGYREFIVSRHHSLSAASGLSLYSPVLSPSLRRQTKHLYLLQSFLTALCLPPIKSVPLTASKLELGHSGLVIFLQPLGHSRPQLP